MPRENHNVQFFMDVELSTDAHFKIGRGRGGGVRFFYPKIGLSFNQQRYGLKKVHKLVMASHFDLEGSRFVSLKVESLHFRDKKLPK